MHDARILIIDDDPNVFDDVRERLADITHEVDWAQRPEVGLEAATRTKPDVILLDIEMPDMDGLEVCRQLKETEATREIPVLFLTEDRSLESLGHALDCGGADYILKPCNEIDLRARIRVALHTRRMIDLLSRQARIDALTGLSNRAALDVALTAALASHVRFGQPFALLMLDVDHIGRINDAHGYRVGDDVMREVASALRGRCRPYDAPCRLGSDAFAVVLGQTEGRHAERACARILESVRCIELPSECAGAKVTCSGGLVSTSELPRGFNQTEVVKAASEALDQAKQAGRDRLQTASAPRL